jgi:pretoxin HINT domain-containing protein
MSSPTRLYAERSSTLSSAEKRADIATGQGADLMSFLSGAGNRNVHNLIGSGNRFDRSSAGIYTLGNDIAFTPKQFDFGTSDSLGREGDVVVDSVALAVSFGNDFARRLVAAALRGFLAEARTQLVDKGKAQQFQKRLDELTQPMTIAAFAGSFFTGIAAGFMSPVTDLFGLPAFADAVREFIKSTANSILTNAPRLLQEGNAIVAELENELIRAAMEISMEQARDPNYLLKMFESAGDAGVQLAGQMGHSAASQAIHLFESEEEEEDPGWASVLPKDIGAALGNPGWALAATASRAWEYGTERAKKAIFTTGSSRAGYAIGRAIGMVVSNVLLFVFSKGIGNAIAAIGKASSTLAPALRTVGTLVARISRALEVVGGTIEAVEAAIAVVGQRALKPFERVLRPFGELLGRLQTWLRELLGIAERGGAEAAAAAGGKLAGKLEPHVSGGGAAEAKQVAAQGGNVEELSKAAPSPEPMKPPVSEKPVSPTGEAPVAVTEKSGATAAEDVAAKAAPKTAPAAKVEPQPTIESKRTTEPTAVQQTGPAPAKPAENVIAQEGPAAGVASETSKPATEPVGQGRSSEPPQKAAGPVDAATKRANKLRDAQERLKARREEERAAYEKHAEILRKRVKQKTGYSLDERIAEVELEQARARTALAEGEVRGLSRPDFSNYEFTDLGKKPVCFVPGTLVKTPNGDRLIETLQEGEMVWSFDFKTGTRVARRILQVHRNWTERTIHLGIENDRIVVTPMHPFWVPAASEWRTAGKLHTGVTLATTDGPAPLVSVACDDTLTATVNLEVSECHNFFVGSVGILVHNGGREFAETEFAKATLYDSKIYRIWRKLANGSEQVVYVGKTWQETIEDRFKQHMKEKGWTTKEYRCELIVERRMTAYETAVTEAHYKKFHELQNQAAGRPVDGEKYLLNEAEPISEAKFREGKKLAFNNPCP